MQKSGAVLFIGLCLIVILVFSFLSFKKASDAWTDYSSDNLGMEVEYPFKKLPVVHEEKGQHITYTTTKGKQSFERLGTIVFKQTEEGPADLTITADEFAFSNIQDWISWLENFYGNSADVVISKRVTIVGLQGIIFQTNERGSTTTTDGQNIAFLRNGTVYRISARGFSENDFRRIWESFSFSTK